MDITAMLTGCPFCDWSCIQQLEGTGYAGVHHGLTYELETHVQKTHGVHALATLPTDKVHHVLTDGQPYDPTMFRHPDNTWFSVQAGCARCAWMMEAGGHNIDTVNTRVTNAFNRHTCPEALQAPIPTLKLTVLKPWSGQIHGLRPPAPAEDQMTVGDVNRIARQAVSLSEELTNALNQEANAEEAPIPPREVLTSYVKTVQEMTSWLAHAMGSARPELHEKYSWAIHELVSCQEYLGELRAVL